MQPLVYGRQGELCPHPASGGASATFPRWGRLSSKTTHAAASAPLLCKPSELHNEISLTLPKTCGTLTSQQQNSNLSRAAEGTGPMKPDNLRVCARCQVLRETER